MEFEPYRTVGTAMCKRVRVRIRRYVPVAQTLDRKWYLCELIETTHGHKSRYPVIMVLAREYDDGSIATPVAYIPSVLPVICDFSLIRRNRRGIARFLKYRYEVVAQSVDRRWYMIRSKNPIKLPAKKYSDIMVRINEWNTEIGDQVNGYDLASGVVEWHFQ